MTTNYLEEAKRRLDQSTGDVRDREHKERLTALAVVYASIAQAESLQRIASELEIQRRQRELMARRHALRKLNPTASTL